MITAFDFYEYHLSHTSVELIADVQNYYSESKGEIIGAYNIPEGSESRDVFLSVLELYCTRVISPIRSRPIDEQYLPSDISFSKGYSHLLNCGAFDGDTTRSIYKKSRLKSIVAIEPDLGNFSHLENFLNTVGYDYAGEIISLPLGLSCSTSYMTFQSSGANSHPPLTTDGRLPTLASSTGFRSADGEVSASVANTVGYNEKFFSS